MLRHLAAVQGSDLLRRQDPCDTECSNVNTAAATCTVVACFCPTMTASGQACLNCYASAGETQSASQVSILAIECPPLQLTIPPIGGSPQQSSAVPSGTATSLTAAATNTTPSTSTNTAAQPGQSKSSAHGLRAETFGSVDILVATVFGLVAGLLGILV